MKRIVLTGGGTAGHVTPNLALIPRLLADGWDVHYIGEANGVEKRLTASIPGVTYHSVSTGKLRRYFDPKNFTDPFKVIKGVGQASKLMKKLKPDVVFSKGGFVSVPVVYIIFPKRFFSFSTRLVRLNACSNPWYSKFLST